MGSGSDVDRDSPEHAAPARPSRKAFSFRLATGAAANDLRRLARAWGPLSGLDHEIDLQFVLDPY
jgi:hypothetical protein